MTQNYPAHQVSTKAAWSDATWTLTPYLYCERFSSVAAPGLSSADLVYRFGKGQRPGATSFSTYTPQNLTDRFVKIESVGMPAWYGVIIDRNEKRLGAFSDNGTRIENGVEYYQAVGLEYLLDRQPITQSYFLDANGAEQLINRALPFNGAGGTGTNRANSVYANASTNLSSESAVRLFSRDLTAANAIEWTDREAIEYLLKKFPPKDNSGATSVPFELDYTSELASIDWSADTVECQGRTVRQILNHIVSRRKAMAWKLVIDEEANVVKVSVFSFASSNVSLPSGAVIYANSNPTTIDLDRSGNVRDFTLRDAATQKYDQVVARGARRGSVLSLSNVDSSLDADWSSTAETGYETAATAIGATYTGASAEKKAALNTDARKRDTVARVYSWFAIPADWDGLVQDGEAGTVYSGTRPAFPTLDSNGDATSTAEAVWIPGLRFSTKLPLLEAHDYTLAKIDTGTVTNTLPDNSAPEWLDPFVCLKTATSRWVLAEHIGEASESGDSDREHTWSCNVSVRQDGPGVILRVVGGHQHYLASGDFTAQSGESFDSAQYVNWRNMVVTVYVQQDSHVEESYPADGDVATVSVKRQLVVSVPDAHLDWVPRGTVVSIGPDSDLDRVSTGAFVRDDRQRLKDVAKSVWQWYGVTRREMSVAIQGFYDTWQVGQLVTTIGSGASEDTINSVITAITWDLIDGTTTLATQFANLEFQ